jgi:polysaccharide deacetylase family protein (PEP-CTERM system associated)
MMSGASKEQSVTGVFPTTHCLSIDVESFYESMVESFSVPERFADAEQESSEISENLVWVLKLLDQLAAKATFFFVGRIAERQPETVVAVAARGHEIASHGLFHRRIYGQTRREFRRDIRRCKEILERLSGKPVVGFRAPDFSINQTTVWALDVLRDEGFEYDASMTPTDIHDVYGIPGIKRYLHRLANGLFEFPAATFRLLGRTIPFGGGGYLRLYPLWLTRRLIRSYEQQKQPCMIYIHPYELGPSIPRFEEISFLRKFRHYYNVRGGGRRFEQAMTGFRFSTAQSLIRERSDVL